MIDLHNDVAMRLVSNDYSFEDSCGQLHIDFKKIQGLDVDALFFAAYCDPHFSGDDALAVARLQLERMKEEFAKTNSPFVFASRASEIATNKAAGKISAFLTVEGGYAIDQEDLAPLSSLYEAGARLLTLTHSQNTGWAGSENDQTEKGLNAFGERVVHQLNEMGMIVDVAHGSSETIIAAAKISKTPIVFSHGGIRYFAGTSRAIEDSAIRAIADKGGVVAISYYPPHLQPHGPGSIAWASGLGQREEEIMAQSGLQPIDRFKKLANLFAPIDSPRTDRAGIDAVFSNIDYVIRLVGEDFVALGSDFDGIPFSCEGLEDISRIGNLTAYLSAQGYTQARIEKIFRGNASRVLHAVLR